MQPTLILPFAALFCGLAVLLAWMVRVPVRERRRWRMAAERSDAYRRLHAGVGEGQAQAHFSYWPATQALVVDAGTARMHGLEAPSGGWLSEITLTGWHQLPAAARAAAWIDEALADGLERGQPVRCEYLARIAGRPDQHMVLTAMPAPLSGLLVGVLSERRKA